ncbi:LysR family transcriptional regulator [Salinispira pacifica]|uniref:Transcriptional activator MetR n=1 Tax=Salinispira pacifica TaxID=1307761 RepID=V5WL42_9SPIO|nr:LysR family transcriptional regulator [Salinispira pacifica]AHC16522.1 Transcriptional activator MetR [Salinispira pacifica]
MNIIERQHLEILESLSREGTLSRAAEALALSQPALTHSIRRLENQLGLQIWEKQGRRIVLTGAGQAILRSAGQILPRFAKLEEELANRRSGVASTLIIGVECHPCYQWLLQSLKRFLAKYPGTDTRIDREFQFAAMDALLNHKIDLLITPDPYVLKSLRFHPLKSYELRLVLSAAHPLAEKAELLPEDLSGELLLTYPVEITRLDIYTRFLIPGGNMLPQRRELDSHEMMLLLVEAGRGITVMPDWLIPDTDGIVSRRIGEEGLHKVLSAGVRKEDETREDIAGFLQAAAENASGDE